ncbi:MAG: hypothetical protein CVV25_03720 [Ignavibacteriae bacterium HGW-Ignavibacteriae-4]|jgi:hypothetical protein|nr:MAG: hypothetical protein CVV25_03720 [Ignavibacteriae bacterium HGW-Ignavibacteriae-4]
MKNLKSLLVALLVAAGIIGFSSCDVTNISDVVLQMTVDFDPIFEDKMVPDSSIDLTDLNDYETYRDNKEDIEDAQILHFNYRIDEIKTENNMDIDSIVFESVNFYMILTTANGDRIPGQRYKLGEFKNLHVSDYYKTAKHIIEVPSELGNLISEQIKSTPYFVFVTEYSGLVGENVDNRFDYIKSHMDMVLRIKTK